MVVCWVMFSTLVISSSENESKPCRSFCKIFIHFSASTGRQGEVLTKASRVKILWEKFQGNNMEEQCVVIDAP